MRKIVELPLVEPMFSTYHHAPSSAIIVNNLSIRNWFLNQATILNCTRSFLKGRTTPDINMNDIQFEINPYLDKIWIPMQFLKGQVNAVIKNLIDEGFYVCFGGIDDYYVEGKSWYHEKHFNHDGCICGYNDENKTYCIYAYDQNWIYQKFWTPQKSFNAGRKAMFRQNIFGYLCALRVRSEQASFSVDTALSKIAEYLDSSMEKYPETEDGPVYGITVQEYIAKYVGKLYDGSIPYERMDRRVFRMIWEHKKVMLERIQCIERELSIDSDISDRYEAVVNAANTIRMLYASHHMKRRDSVLPIVQKKLLWLNKLEIELLTELLSKSKRNEST